MALRQITQEEVDQIASPEAMKFVNTAWTICEVIRTLYLEAEKVDREDMMELCRTAFAMAKRMDASMKEKAFGPLPKPKDKEQAHPYGREQ
jgi:hypothetical protein